MTETSQITTQAVLGRIDEAWVAWLKALDQVPADRRTEPGACGYWSVNDLCAHLAFWDSSILDHIERDRVGMTNHSIDVDAINQQLYLENRDRDPALVRADMFRAHFAAVTAIRAIDYEPSEALLEGFACETWDHYPEHTGQVLSWLAGNQAGATLNPAQISAKYDRAVSDGMILFMQIPEDQRDQPGLCGVWSAKDLLGHLAFWDGYRLARIDAEMAGNEIPVIDDTAPYDRTNAEQAALRSDWSWEQVLEEATGVHDRLVEVLLVGSAHDQSTAGNHWDLHRSDLDAWFAQRS